MAGSEVWVVVVGGKRRRFPSLQAAIKVAQKIFKATGVVVGIEKGRAR